MACGASYEYLVQAAGGRSRSKPYDSTLGMQLWCNEPDAQAWYAQASHVFHLQRAAWNTLMAHANEVQDWTLTRNIEPSASAYESEFFGLKEPSFWMGFGAGGCADAVQSYISNIDTGKCVLERLNQALAKVGKGTVEPGDAPPPPGERSWVPWAIAGGAAATSVLLVWWIYARRPRPLPPLWAGQLPPALPPPPAIAA